ncbi:hypothetical protein DASB73_023990 [Starmerella bacillaris]|uniref:DUF788-domain-containing protein n=1 Tax=Starmerella bacillaris TaxID=1247836 RepID=A0AAV5RJU0_STABA|nr:hypothetical protein DASB73_023990 [Starmerella bacillaris]
MANASNKRIAQLNKGTLLQLDRISFAVYVSAFVYFLVSKRNIFLDLLLCSPGFLAQYWLHKTCGPKYDENKQLIKAGLYINQGGVIEYMKDIMILSWGLAMFSVGFGRKAYFGWLIVPVYAVYKGINIFRTGKAIMSGGSDKLQ